LPRLKDFICRVRAGFSLSLPLSFGADRVVSGVPITKLPAGITTISGQVGQSRKVLTVSAAEAAAVNKPISKHMARMVALLIMVRLHDTQNRMSHCSAHQELQAQGTDLTRSRQAVRRPASVFGVISLDPRWRAQRPNQHHKINGLDHGMPVADVI